MRAEPRRFLLEAYRAAVAAVDGRRLVFDALVECSWPRLSLLAIGKAAPAMAFGALDRLGDRVQDALVITTEGNADPTLAGPRLRQLESSHPIPDARSLDAGAAVADFLAAGTDPLLVLVSGGSSALVELLPEGVEPSDLEALNHWLLGSGLSIGDMNRVRKAVSLLKGGRLLTRLAERPVLQLLLSDVPGDELHVIGSGPLVPDPRPQPLPAGLPDWIRATAGRAPPAPTADDPMTEAVQTRLVGGNGSARQAAAAWARSSGLHVHEQGFLGGDAVDAAETILALRESPGLHVWGGEITVRLPQQPGRGGRCQALATLVAGGIAGREGTAFLAAGTDGRDGPGDDAGALVDGGTIGRAVREGHDAARAVAKADTGTLLEATGDLLHTGPTGTNVADLYLLWVGG